MSIERAWRQLEIGEEEGGRTPRPASVAPLSQAEWRTLEECEATVEAGFRAWVAWSRALGRIRAEKLYRVDYATFEMYCRERWGLSYRRVHQLIDAAEVCENVAGENVKNSSHLPQPNPSQAAELARLPDPGQQCEVWEAATAGAPRVTAAKVRELVDERRGGGNGWLPETRTQAMEIVRSFPAEQQPAAAGFIGLPFLPAERAMTALENLRGMGDGERGEVLALSQSPDSRDRDRAAAVIYRHGPTGDPRRMILDSLLPELRHCARAFPDDPLTASYVALVDAVSELIAATRAQEEARKSGTDSH